jgi:hypothetical protein
MMAKFDNILQVSRTSCSLLIVLLLSISAGCVRENNDDSIAKSNRQSAIIEAKGKGDTGNLAAGSFVLPTFAGTAVFARIAIGLERQRNFLIAGDLEAGKLYVDWNQNSDLTESDEVLDLVEGTKIGTTRYWSATVPQIEQGEDIHTNLLFKFSKNEAVSEEEDSGSSMKAAPSVKGTFSLTLWGVERSATDAHLVPLLLSQTADGCPLVHFNGPLTMGEYRFETKLEKSKEIKFYAFVGTAGEGKGTTTPIANTEIPADAHPVAEFTFSNRESGKPPIVVKSILKTRC